MNSGLLIGLIPAVLLPLIESGRAHIPLFPCCVQDKLQSLYRSRAVLCFHFVFIVSSFLSLSLFLKWTRQTGRQYCFFHLLTKPHLHPVCLRLYPRHLLYRAIHLQLPSFPPRQCNRPRPLRPHRPRPHRARHPRQETRTQHRHLTRLRLRSPRLRWPCPLLLQPLLRDGLPNPDLLSDP